MTVETLDREFKASGATTRSFDYRWRNWHGARQDVPDLRRKLYQGPLGLIEYYGASSPNATPLGYSNDSQIAVLLFGAMSWRVSQRVSLTDANTGLFIRAGEEFAEEHPIPDVGHSALLVTPSQELIDELSRGKRSNTEEIFAADTRPASARAQLLAHRMVANSNAMTPVEFEELAIAFLQEMIGAECRPTQGGANQLIHRTKALLHEMDCEPLSLVDVAARVGVSPIYLTQAFKRSEGIPLYRYQSRLRLSRALAEIPFETSLTALALDLGYSSHSHFTAAFRSVFGLSPSCYRDEFR